MSRPGKKRDVVTVDGPGELNDEERKLVGQSFVWEALYTWLLHVFCVKKATPDDMKKMTSKEKRALNEAQRARAVPFFPFCALPFAWLCHFPTGVGFANLQAVWRKILLGNEKQGGRFPGTLPHHVFSEDVELDENAFEATCSSPSKEFVEEKSEAHARGRGRADGGRIIRVPLAAKGSARRRVGSALVLPICHGSTASVPALDD